MDIGKRVKQLREKQGKTQHSLGIEAGITSSHVAQIENGRIRSPRADLLSRLARALGVSMEDLLGEKRGAA